MREGIRHTICLSTQVGCAMGCAFCATGTLGFTRNLTVGEMLLQAVEMARREGRITKRRLHGHGRAAAQFGERAQGLESLADPKRFALGTRKITLSTCGIVPGNRGAVARAGAPAAGAFAQFRLSRSQREQLMPIARRHPLERVPRGLRRLRRADRQARDGPSTCSCAA